MIDLSALAIEDFSPHVGKAFRLCADNGECQVLLKETRDAKRYARNEQVRAPFSLLFAGPSGMSFQQGAYTLNREGLGEIPIFLVPVGIEEGAVQLEAVFN
ncbi:MAG: hypothetical protein WAW41_00695 [Methylobacter sp.]